MSKQTSYEKKLEDAAETAMRIGAGVLTATAFLVSTERLMHLNHHDAAALGSGQHAAAETQPARAEGARETARLPEEYDVGLRAPYTSGA